MNEVLVVDADFAVGKSAEPSCPAISKSSIEFNQNGEFKSPKLSWQLDFLTRVYVILAISYFTVNRNESCVEVQSQLSLHLQSTLAV